MKLDIKIITGSEVNRAYSKIINFSNLVYSKKEYASIVKLAVASIF